MDIAALENLTNLSELHLAYNRIADLTPLAKNMGLDKGALIDVRGNPLTDESFEVVIPALAARGVRVLNSAPPRLEFVHDDSVMVLRVGENLATQTLYNGLALDAYASTLYSHFEDAFDFVMFFSNLDDIDQHENARYYGVYSSVRNDTAGIGRGTFYDSRYGSVDKLKGVIHFPYNRALRSGPSLHEMLHAWANFAVPTAVGGHWGFSSAAGQLGGFELGNLVELGGRPLRGGAVRHIRQRRQQAGLQPHRVVLRRVHPTGGSARPVGCRGWRVGRRGRELRENRGWPRCLLGERCQDVLHRGHRGQERRSRPEHGGCAVALPRGSGSVDGCRPSAYDRAARSLEPARGVVQPAGGR